MIMAIAAALTACGGNTQKKAPDDVQTAEVVDMHNAENALDIAGTYKGTFPAADCPGIEVTLTLDADKSYTEHNKYIDRDSEFTDKGTYAVSENTLTLTPAEGTPSYYKVEENRLRRLDADKQVITGPLAENYILKKSE